MSALKWTKEMPTASGFYWVETDYDQNQMVVEVVMEPRCAAEPIAWIPGVEMETRLKEECFVAWAGPIPKPEEEAPCES